MTVKKMSETEKKNWEQIFKLLTKASKEKNPEEKKRMVKQIQILQNKIDKKSKK